MSLNGGNTYFCCGIQCRHQTVSHLIPDHHPGFSRSDTGEVRTRALQLVSSAHSQPVTSEDGGQLQLEDLWICEPGGRWRCSPVHTDTRVPPPDLQLISKRAGKVHRNNYYVQSGASPVEIHVSKINLGDPPRPLWEGLYCTVLYCIVHPSAVYLLIQSSRNHTSVLLLSLL